MSILGKRYIEFKNVNLLFLSLIVTLFINVNANAQSYPFKIHSIEDGLSQAVVHDIIQDKQGYIWIATGYGLSKYNGHEFRNFYTKDGLPSNKITALYRDNADNLWVGTDKGIAIVYGNDFILFEDTDKWVNRDVNAIYQDLEGNYWFGTEGLGLIRYDGQQFTVFDNKETIISDNVRSIGEDSNGNLWIGTRNGLFRYNKSGFVSVDIEVPDKRIRSVIVNPYDEIIVGTRSGVFIYKNRKKVKVFNTSTGLKNDRITDLRYDRSGRLWVSTEDGVSVIQNGNTLNLDNTTGFTFDMVNKLFEDINGNIWMGTFGSGLILYHGDYFQNYSIQTGFKVNMVSAVAHQGDKLWIGTYGDGLYLLENGKLNPLNGLFDNRVFGITIDDDNRVWVSTREGITLIDKFQTKILSPDFLGARKIRKVLQIDKKKYVIGTDDEGLLLFDGTSILQHISTSDGLSSNSIRSLFYSKVSGLLVGTLEGVNILNEKFEVVDTISVVDGLISNGVLDIKMDNKGVIWMGNYGGYSTLENNRIKGVPVIISREPAVVYALEIENDKLWLGTNKGLIVKNRDDEFENSQLYTHHNGLISNEINLGALSQHKNQIAIGTVGGLSIMNISEKKRNGNIVPIIEKISIYDKDIPITKQVDLAPNDNYLQIHYTGFNYFNNGLYKYRYKLTPLDLDWQYSNNPVASYNALLDGEYGFKLQTHLSNGEWEKAERTLSIVIHKPFYKTLWFISLVILIISGILYLIYSNIRTARLIDMERMRVRIASDLHDDVGSSLTEIALQSDFVQSITMTEDIKDSLKQLGEMSRKVVGTMDDIVWSIDSRNDTLGDLTDRIQDFCLNNLSKLNIEVFFNFEGIDMNKIIAVEDRQHLYLITKEAVNNAIKYASATRIDITLNLINGKYNLEICDNGVGLSNSKKKTGHGIRNIEMRCKELGAKLDMDGEKGLCIKVSEFLL